MSFRETPYRVGTWITTYTGVKFYPLNPNPDDIRTVDIAHALSNQCRFAGHVIDYYSVAQHSVQVSKHCDERDALWGLLHDAAEAYLTDIPRPVKHTPDLEGFRQIEDKIMLAVCERYDLEPVMPVSVKKADTVELVTEAEWLMIGKGLEWREEMGVEPREGPLPWLTPIEARSQFIARFRELTLGEQRTAAP